MDLSNAAVAEEIPAALLRGTARGLELIVSARASADAIAQVLEAKLGEAPAFFRGSDVRIAVDDGPLATGCLARLDELAGKFDLRIVEVAAHAAPTPQLATGSAPVADAAPPTDATPPADAAPLTDAAPLADAAPATDAAPEPSAPPVLALVPISSEPSAPLPELPPAAPVIHVASPADARRAAAADAVRGEIEQTVVGPRIVIGPVRSGVILDHVGHLVVFGDVNPGAEIRATGNIVVLGRLRGTAHAGIGAPMGFILALRLEPQQLRIGRQVARAGDSDTPYHDAEIAYATGEQIVVEKYTGKLPKNLASSLA